MSGPEPSGAIPPVKDIVRAALAEAGYPDADVWTEDRDGPVWIEGPPSDVIDKACEIANVAYGVTP